MSSPSSSRTAMASTHQLPTSLTTAKEKDTDIDTHNQHKTHPAFPTSPHPSTLTARLSHFTWAWYTSSMATGGIALLLHPATQPHSFTGLLTIGKTVFIFDIALFLAITTCITYRFTTNPATFRASLTHPTESLFASTSLISLASIIACTARYGIPSSGPWLPTAWRVLFWTYYALTWLVAIIQYVALFTNPSLKIQDMTPAWDLPIFPVMLSGTLAAVGANTQPPQHAAPIIIAGVLAQGLGFLVSVLMYASYVRRMIQYGFPSPASRPAMFIAVGPPAFTALALIGMAEAWPALHYAAIFSSQTGESTSVSQLAVIAQTTQVSLRVLALATAVFIWSLSFWFFCIGLISTLVVARELRFRLNWNAFVFPNVGFTIAIISIGRVLRSEAVMWVGSVLTVLLVALYLFVQVMCVRAVWAREVLYEGKDEDVYVKEKKGKSERRTRDGDESGKED
jgi:C4-dicarboxylate transporter/malic acid transport protein